MNYNNLNLHNITGTLTTKTLTERDKFCEYYRCSILPTDKVVKYQNIFNSPQKISNPVPFETYSEEKLFYVQITEGMLQDLIEHTNKMIEECEIRSKDPRLMKMYSEYITFMNLLK